jgi:hypothetical protein
MSQNHRRDPPAINPTKNSSLFEVPFILFGLHGLAAIAIVAWTPLQAGWKGLIAASSIAFFAIPPIIWRFIQRTHETEVRG